VLHCAVSPRITNSSASQLFTFRMHSLVSCRTIQPLHYYLTTMPSSHPTCLLFRPSQICRGGGAYRMILTSTNVEEHKSIVSGRFDCDEDTAGPYVCNITNSGAQGSGSTTRCRNMAPRSGTDGNPRSLAGLGIWEGKGRVHYKTCG
jgi:hypothetical protein